MDFTYADAGTLYLMTERKTLSFEILRNETLDIAMGGTTGKPVELPDVEIYDENGNPNLSNVAAAAAVTGDLISIEDAYTSEEFDFSLRKIFCS